MSVPTAESFDPDALPPGTALCGGRFVIESVIGRGGVATVYRVRTEDGRRLALKLMVAERADDPEQRQRFTNEWQVLEGLRDLPFVVSVEDHGFLEPPDGRPYFTMELLESPTLDELAFSARLHADDRVVRACRIVRQVADAVAQLHARGVVHRDIKPSNIVVEGPDEIRLLDFGYAHSSGEGSVPATPGLTTTEQRPGTYLYMAPEQAIGMSPEPSFDIYALAITLYEALAGKAPNHDLPVSEMARIKCEMKEPEISIAGRVFGIPRSLEQLVDDGLRRVAPERIQSAEEFRDRLDEVLVELGGIETAEPERRRPVVAANEVEPIAPRARVPSPARISETEIEIERPRRARVPSPAHISEAEIELEHLRRARVPSPAPVPEPAPARRRRWLWVAPFLLVAVVLAGFVVAQPWDEPEGDLGKVTRSERSEQEPDAPVAGPGTGPEPEPEVGPGVEGSDDDDSMEPDLGTGAEAVEPEPATKPTGRPKRRPKPRKPTPAAGPSPDDPECVASRERAATANTRGDWTTVLQETRQRACWGSNTKRLSLRLSALYESGKYEQCAALADKVSDPTSRSIARLCQRKLDDQP